MLCVKTKLAVSNISGIGLFANQFISNGAIVWRYEPSLDILFKKDEVLKFSKASQQQFFNYSFFDRFHNKYMLCGDDGRFFNHSNDNNCDDSKCDVTFAIKDILPGEELTVNYKQFYGDIHEHPEIK